VSVSTRLLNIREAAAYLNVPEATLRSKVSQREVPHTRIFRHVRFTPDDLQSLIDAGREGLAPAASERRKSSARGVL
jgi:excisionase family DNA binding protein